MFFRRRGQVWSSALLLSAALSGCGGGSGGNATAPTSRVGGTAAVGSPIVSATVTLRCQNNAAYTTSTGSSGDWARVIPVAELPCAVRVNGGTVGAGSGAVANTQTYYSLTSSSGTQVTVNITPLTSLALARALGATLDDAWFDGLSDAARQQLVAGLDVAISALRTALAGYDLPEGFNPFYVPFTATANNVYDDLLEQLRMAIEEADSSFEAQLAGFAGGGDLPPVVDDGEPSDTPPDTPPGTDPGDDGDLPDTTLSVGVQGVRLATSGTVGGVAQNGSIREWLGGGSVDVGSAAGILSESYLVISAPFSSFGLRNVPNAPGTYACGDSLGQTNPRNIELAYAAGQGYSSVGTGGVTGFSCSITVTSVGTNVGGSYAGTLEGHFTARLFKTGAPVNLSTSVSVNGHFRLGGN